MTPEEFRKKLRESLAENRKRFQGIYKNQINELLGLSREEIDRITPDTTDLEVYDQLITVVKEASAANVSQAELKTHIEDLGAVAIEIAKKVGSLDHKPRVSGSSSGCFFKPLECLDGSFSGDYFLVREREACR